MNKFERYLYLQIKEMDSDTQIKTFFAGKPTQQAMFQLIHKALGSLGNVTIKVTKSQIAFMRERQFAWVWYPMAWDTKRPPNSLVLSFALGTRLTHPRIVQVVEPYPGRWMHHVIIGAESDVDDTVREWLRNAYAFGIKVQRHRQKKEDDIH